ncbi:MAG: (Fe-S)-binding protein [Acidobacteriota bacterium]|nr:(Fe-S)-binding protein [Acidobacteriota bacterium]
MGRSKDSAQAVRQCGDECSQCGLCVSACDLLQQTALTPGEIAQKLLAGADSPALRDLIQRCDLCGFCTHECPSEQNAGAFFKSARALLLERGSLDIDGYEPILVDQDWNTFSLYRETFHIHYDDLKPARYDTLFFPGCSVATYAPQIVHAVYDWLRAQGMAVGVTELCCGKVLESIGLEARTAQLKRYLLAQLRAAGATRLVTACPNCHASLSGALEGIEVISLYSLLRDAGVELSGSQKLTIHDSCADREKGQFGGELRAMLGSHPLVEMEHSRQETICCGSGGIVPMVAPELCSQRAQRRIEEFERTGAECMVTQCMSCSRRLSSQAQTGQVRHCLELLFGIAVDYEQIAANQQSMWEGECGELNRARLEQAKIFTEEERGASPSATE